MLKKIIKTTTEATKVLAGMAIMTGIAYILVKHNLNWFVPTGTYGLFEWIDLMNKYTYVKIAIWNIFDFCAWTSVIGVLVTLLMKIISNDIEEEAQA